MLSSDEVVAGIGLLGSVGTALGVVVRHVAGRIAASEEQARKREQECIDRLQKSEDGHLGDYRDLISKNISVIADSSASKRELSAAVDRMAVAIAGLPSQRDPVEVMRDLRRRVRDITPPMQPVLPGDTP